VPLFFTHIPKTAGTSFKLGLILPNVAPEKILQFEGVRALLREGRKPFDFLDGHYPYGIHWFGAGSTPVMYVTILREPVDRAISQYYFIKQCDTDDYQHPDLEDTRRWDIGSFYAQPKHQDLQTKFTAGLLAMKLTSWFPRALPKPLLLARAKHNLSKKYHLVGLVERMAEFEEMVAKQMGWRNLKIRDHSKVTRNRPAIDAISDATKTAILSGNRLDVELYAFAEKLFASRIEQN
jgi:Sulfotransferase family